MELKHARRDAGVEYVLGHWQHVTIQTWMDKEPATWLHCEYTPDTILNKTVKLLDILSSGLQQVFFHTQMQVTVFDNFAYSNIRE